MLRINVISSAGQARSYFNDHLVKGDYYSKDAEQEVSSFWRGAAAEKMGLPGDVSQADFEALVDAKNPRTNEPLTQRTKDNRRVGYDLTFSAPKSVSVLYARTGDEWIVNAFRESVQETMQEIETDVRVRVRQGGSKDGSRVTGNALWSAFLHQETRPVDGKPDPHLHQHAVLHNVTFDEHYKNRDGSTGAWLAADLSDVKRNAPYFQAAMDARLAGKLQDLGLCVRQSESSFELAGFSERIKQTFSRRTAQIEAKAAELGITDQAIKSELGAKTREGKRNDLSQAEMITEWNSRLTDRQWDAFTSQAEGGAFGPKVTADEAIEYGLGHSLERQSVARQSDVLAAALRRGVSISPEEIQAALATRDDVIAASSGGQKLVTTKNVLEEEQAMVAFARDGRGTSAPFALDFQFRSITRGGDSFQLNAQQKAAVRHVLESRSRVMIVRGAAGTGKTSMMAEAIRGISENGRQVQAFAPTSAARDVLQQDGVDAGVLSLQNAQTVAKLLNSKEIQTSLRNQAIVIDEAGLISSPDMKKVFDVAERQNTRVILLGDYKQHSSVQRGDALRILIEQAGIRPVEITQIQRQRNAVYREAVNDLSRGSRADVVRGFDTLDQMGLVEEIGNREERNSRLADGYVEAVKAGKTSLVVSPTHREGNAVTDQIRSRLKDEGVIGAEEHAVTRLRNLQFTDAQKSNPFAYEEGMVVEFHKPSKVIASSTLEREYVVGMGPHGPTIHSQFEQNSRTTQLGYNWKGESGLERVAPVEKGLTYGTRGVILGRDDQESVLMRTDAGDIVSLPLQEARKFSVYEESRLDLATGDSIRITQNMNSKPQSKQAKKHRLANGSIYRVDGFTKSGDIRLENGWILDQERAGHLAHGYVTTSHSSQGKTRDVVFVAQSSDSFAASNMAQFYVSVSRAKDATVVVTDDKQALRNQAITRSNERMASTELAVKSWQQRGLNPDEHAVRQRRFVSRLRDAGKRARQLARKKAEQMKAAIEKARHRWRDRRKGMGYEH